MTTNKNGFRVIKDFLLGRTKFSMLEESFNSLKPSCLDLLPEPQDERLRMAMGTENGGVFIFDPVLKAQNDDKDFIRFNFDPESELFKDRQVSIVQWLPKQVALVSSGLSKSKIHKFAEDRNLLCVVFDDGTTYFYNTDVD